MAFGGRYPPDNALFDTYLNQIEQDFAQHRVAVNGDLPIAFREINYSQRSKSS